MKGTLCRNREKMSAHVIVNSPTNKLLRTVHSKSDIKVPTINLIHLLGRSILGLEQNPVNDHEDNSTRHHLRHKPLPHPTTIHIHHDTIEIIQCE